MSLRKQHLILSEQAKADIIDILQYTYEQWGEPQVNAYSVIIDQALSHIHEHSHLGKKVPEISQHHRAMNAGQHIIFYTVTDSAINIARVLHNKMDIKARF
jgi:toxin ParE1/3/4